MRNTCRRDGQAIRESSLQVAFRDYLCCNTTKCREQPACRSPYRKKERHTGRSLWGESQMIKLLFVCHGRI